MDSDTKLLSEIYNSAVNAIAVISSLPDCLTENDFFGILFDEMTRYREIANQAMTLLCTDTVKAPEPQNVSEKISLWTAKQITKSCTDSRHAASIILRGSVEGIHELITCINVCTGARKESMQLAFRLIETEEHNIKECRQMLEFK